MLSYLGKLLIVPALAAAAAIGLLTFVGCRLLLSFVTQPDAGEDDGGGDASSFLRERRRRAATLLR